MEGRQESGMGGLASTTEKIAFVRRKGKYYPAKQTKLKNSLLAIVGCLEFANSMDFAANVWNTIPVPLFAAVLMGIGGSVALVISIFAFQDAALSRRNITFLLDERRRIKKLKAARNEASEDVPNQDVYLDITFREIGTELIDRIGMDTIMGFSAILVGTGTLMAIGGANREVYQVSNLFSGYIGNGLSAFYGVVNTVWSLFTWRRAHRHAVAGGRHLTAPDVKTLQRQRNSIVKFHAGLNGITGLVAGIAGIITTTRWWGYVVLVPCIISAMYCNSVWRRKIGYERPSILHSLGRDIQQTIEDIQLAASAQCVIRDVPSMAFQSLVSNTKSISSVMDFIVMNGFFEAFSIRLLQNSDLSTAILGPLQLEMNIDSLALLTTREPHTQALFSIVETSIRETGLSTFRDRQRFLLDILGCQLCAMRPAMVDIEMIEKQATGSEPNESSTTDVFVTPPSRAEPVEKSSKETINTFSKAFLPNAGVSLAISDKEAGVDSQEAGVENQEAGAESQEAGDPSPRCVKAGETLTDTGLAWPSSVA